MGTEPCPLVPCIIHGHFVIKWQCQVAEADHVYKIENIYHLSLYRSLFTLHLTQVWLDKLHILIKDCEQSYELQMMYNAFVACMMFHPSSLTGWTLYPKVDQSALHHSNETLSQTTYGTQSCILADSSRYSSPRSGYPCL